MIRKYASALDKRQGIIVVGRLEKRKNILNILKGYELYAENNNSAEPLYLAGAPGYGFLQIKTLLDSLIDKGLKIEVLDYLKPDEYFGLLGRSRILLYASLYEGFGLPILEAFAAKTVVITSNVSSMPEVAGDGAEYVNPGSPRSIAGAIKNVSQNDNYRRKLIENGNLQIKKYSWSKTAEGILKVLRNVAESND
jgi:alpha-1,3-rhamnosyl/mannosyltransferase